MENEIEKTESDDEISLIDLFAVLWRQKIMIILITLIAAAGVVAYSIISIKLPPEKSYLPNVYTPKALMLIDNRSSGGVSLGGLGGLASLAGVNVPVSASFSDLAVFLTETNSFLDSIVDAFDLINLYNIETSPRAKSRKIIKDSLKTSYDGSSGVLSISFTHSDPVFARDIVDYSTDWLERRFNELGVDKNKIENENLELNIESTYREILELEEENRRLEQSVAFGSSGRVNAITTDLNRISMELSVKTQVYTQLKVQNELLKVTMASEKPVFQILERAEIPDQKSGPSRGMICIIVTLAAGFFSVFLAFVLNAISNIRKDPVAMAKLKGTYEK